MNMKTTPFILGALLLAACAADTPESAGARIAEKKCACELIGHERSISALKATQKALDKDSGLAKEEATRIYKELYPDERKKADKVQEEQCEEEGKKLVEEMKLKFPRQDDRQTIENAVNDRVKICKRERDDEAMEYEPAIYLLFR